MLIITLKIWNFLNIELDYVSMVYCSPEFQSKVFHVNWPLRNQLNMQVVESMMWLLSITILQEHPTSEIFALFSLGCTKQNKAPRSQLTGVTLKF